jgi:uncharacterized protein
MKYFLALLGVVWLAWQWRSARRQRQLDVQQKPHTKPSSATPSTVEMIRCSHCGVHIPSTDVVMGQRGNYCSEAHRNGAEN